MRHEFVGALVAVLLVAAAGFWITHYMRLGVLMYHDLHMNDFGKFYYATQMLLDGRDMYGPSPATAIPVPGGATKEFWNLNPPHFHLLMLPLARLSAPWALGWWVVINLAALGWSVVAIVRELRVRLTYGGVLIFAACLLFCSATGMIIFTGQMTFLLLLPFTLAWIDARHGRWARAGVWLGALAGIKPFFAIFLGWLLYTRQFAAVAAFVTTAGASLLAGVMIFGGDAHASWLRALAAVDWEWASMNGSLPGVLTRTFVENPLYAPVAHAPAVAAAGTIAAAAIVVGLTLRGLARDANVDRTWAVVFLGGTLLSPLGWLYYLWMLLGPAWALVRRWRERPAAGREALLALAVPGLICPISIVLFWRHEAWATPTIGSLYTWSTVFLWLAVLTAREDTPPRS